MPVIFIHGVNTRDNDDYRKNRAARDELLQRLVLEPLAAKEKRFKQIEIVNPYWGNLGVSFRWDQASLPEVHTLEHLGAEDGGTPESDLELTETVKDLAGTLQRDSSRLENLGTDESMFKRAAEKDLTRFVETILSPLLLSEMRLAEDIGVKPETEGVLQALLAMAAKEVASDPHVKVEVIAASSDDEVMDLLKEKVKARFEQLAQGELAAPREVTPLDKQLESLGSDWLDGLKDRVGELFDRAKDAPARVAGASALDLFRDGLHRNFSRFLGDVFVYLNERGDKTNPGPIVSTVIEAIKTAPKHHPDEPLIIITHSMGGNILYDILTYYDTNLKVDIWVSVASQVGQFEEMKIFKASNKNIYKPNKVTGLKPPLGYWLNVFDPLDSFGFKTAPIFADVNADVEYLTGAGALKSHGEYFGRASFYQIMREHIEGASYDTYL
jgi:hypothetical protein